MLPDPKDNFYSPSCLSGSSSWLVSLLVAEDGTERRTLWAVQGENLGGGAQQAYQTKHRANKKMNAKTTLAASGHHKSIQIPSGLLVDLRSACRAGRRLPARMWNSSRSEQKTSITTKDTVGTELFVRLISPTFALPCIKNGVSKSFLNIVSLRNLCLDHAETRSSLSTIYVTSTLSWDVA